MAVVPRPMTPAMLGNVWNSQSDGEIFYVVFVARQRDGECWINSWFLEFVDEMDFKLIVINCGEERKAS